MSHQHCTFVFYGGAWHRDSTGSKDPLWVVVSFLTQGSHPRTFCLLHFPLFLSLILGLATLFALSWSAEPDCFSFAFLYIVVLSSQTAPHSPPFFLPNPSVLCEVFPDISAGRELPLISDQTLVALAICSTLCTSHPAHAS